MIDRRCIPIFSIEVALAASTGVAEVPIRWSVPVMVGVDVLPSIERADTRPRIARGYVHYSA